MDRRGALSLLGITAVSLYGGSALASTARAVTLERLVERSTTALVVTAVAKHASWQTIGGGRRIVTETEASVKELVAGDDPGTSEVLVRTLGGRVGNLGQIVEGEAELLVGEECLVFLTRLDPSIFSVTAMAQGEYPIVSDARGRLLTKSRRLPALIQQRGAAVERLPGLSVKDALEAIRAVRP